MKIWESLIWGPVDGHDIKKLYKIFQEAKKIDHAVLVHVLTEKGKGYLPAEKMPSKFHGTGCLILPLDSRNLLVTKTHIPMFLQR